MCCLLWRYMSICVFAFWGGIISLAAAFLALLFVFMFELLVCVRLFTTHELSNPELQLWSQEEGREYKIKKKKKHKKSGWLKVLVAHLFCVIRAAQRRPDPPGLWVDSPGTLAVRLGAAPLVLQVAWEAELPYRGEGLGLLDNPKSAWSSHAKAAASGKDTRVLNSQNKERRTRDSLFFFSLPPARARRCTYLRAIASVNARILGLWSHAICHFIHRSHATRWFSHTGGKTSYENLEVMTQSGLVTLFSHGGESGERRVCRQGSAWFHVWYEVTTGRNISW